MEAGRRDGRSSRTPEQLIQAPACWRYTSFFFLPSSATLLFSLAALFRAMPQSTAAILCCRTAGTTCGDNSGRSRNCYGSRRWFTYSWRSGSARSLIDIGTGRSTDHQGSCKGCSKRDRRDHQCAAQEGHNRASSKNSSDRAQARDWRRRSGVSLARTFREVIDKIHPDDASPHKSDDLRALQDFLG